MRFGPAYAFMNKDCSKSWGMLVEVSWLSMKALHFIRVCSGLEF